MSKASISIANQLALGGKNDGVDIRNPSSAVFGISSIDRYRTLQSGERNPINPAQLTSPYDFTIETAGQPFMSGFFTRLALTEIRFPWTMPTITARNANIIAVYTDGGGTSTDIITVPDGWYTPTTLAAALQTATRTATANAGFTVSYDGVSDSFTARTNNTDTFYFRRAAFNAAGPNAITLFEMMAWDNNQVAATSQVSGTVVNLLSTQFVDIVCDNLTLNQSLKDSDSGTNSRDILCRVYLTPEGYTGDPTLLGSFPHTIQRQFCFPKQIKWTANQSIANMRFQVYDDQGYILTTADVGNGAVMDYNQGNWNMTLLVSEI